MAKKSILITGGAGFIGNAFVKHLYKKYPNYKIFVLDALTYAGDAENFSESTKKDKRFNFWYGNVKNINIVDKLVAQCDVVVHMAAETHVARSIFDDTIFFETDVMGTQVVASCVLKHYKTIERFIHVSTSEVYGTALKAPMTEEHPLNPTTPYASAKCGADRLVYSYWATYNLPVIILRPFNNYGPFQHLEKVIPRFITNAILNEPLTVHGTGQNTRDWTFVEDTCAVMDRAVHGNIKRLKGEVINIGSGNDVSINNVAQLVLEIMDKSNSLIKHVGDRPGQVSRHISSTVKSKKLLRWKASTKFEEGLRKTISWYEDNRDWWQKLLWMRSVPIITEKGKVEYR